VVACPRGGTTNLGDCEDCVHLRLVTPDKLRCAVSGAEPVHRWMTAAIALATTTPDAGRAAAIEQADAAGVHHLLVVDGARSLVGIVCRCDLGRSDAPDVAGCMTSDVYATGPATPLSEAASAMRLLDISCLPIVDGPFLVGAITRNDLRRAGAPDL
jgi:CBS domain-containing protein